MKNRRCFFGSLGVGAAFAQGGNPPSYPYDGTMMGGRGGYGPAQTYVVDAFAAKLDLPVDESQPDFAFQVWRHIG